MVDRVGRPSPPGASAFSPPTLQEPEGLIVPAAESARLDAHRGFLERVYGPTHNLYNLTRRFLLPGRDRALDELLREPWGSLLELGPGTGRNLHRLRRQRPQALLGGVEASPAMLAHARARCPEARLVPGFAENADLATVLGVRPDRVLLSYALSMMLDPARVIDRATRALAADGTLHIVDFADGAGLPPAVARLLRAWLGLFHVRPLAESLLRDAGARVAFGPCRYFVIARIEGEPSRRESCGREGPPARAAGPA